MSISSRLALALVLVTGSAFVSYAHTTTYTAILSGPLQSPANASPGIGFATVTLDMDLVTMEVDLTFSGLQGTATAAHIHGATAAPLTGTAIVAIPFAGFPTGVTSGAYNQNFDLTQAGAYDAGFIAANSQGNPLFEVSDALNALDAAMDTGRAYINIHSSLFPGGEIRGFLVPAATAPEPASFVFLGLGATALLARRRRTKSTD